MRPVNLRALNWIALAGLMLAACTTPSAAPAPSPTEPIVTLTAPAAIATATATPVPAPVATPAPPSPTPLPPEPASRFRPVDDTDWQDGPADAAVTIVEYGDFQ